MQFAGKVWRLLVGIKDGLVLLFMLLFFSALFAVLTFGTRDTTTVVLHAGTVDANMKQRAADGCTRRYALTVTAEGAGFAICVGARIREAFDSVTD